MEIVSFFGDAFNPDCVKCGLDKNCVFPRMKPTGEGQRRILIVAEAPGASEDKQNKQLVGEAGQFLRKNLSLVGIDLDRDCWKTNAIICRPEKNKTPSDAQIKLCRSNLIKTIREKRPEAIVLLGATAIKSLIGEHVHTTSPTSLSGIKIPLLEYNCWVFPMFHPSFLIRNPHDENLHAYFRWNIQFMEQETREFNELPQIDYNTPIQSETDPDKIIEWFEVNLLQNPDKPIAAVDIESSGLNPFRHNHQIFCMAVSIKDKCISFPIDYKNAYETEDDYLDVIEIVVEWLERDDLFKIAHRSQFETAWLNNIFNCEVKGMHWCSKVAEHLCDNREGITGLKHVVFRRWGITDYAKSVDRYIDTVKGTHYNKMHECPLYDMLHYCGVDAYLTRLLYDEQLKEIGEEPMGFFNEVTNMFSEMTSQGINIDVAHYEKEKLRIKEEIKIGYDELYQSEEVVRFKESTRKDFSFTSNSDLQDFFFTFLGCESKKQTSKGGISVDEESLLKTGHPIAIKLIELRKLDKLVNTYIAQFEREAVDGKIHPIFNVYTAKSFRSSSSNPSFQNLPKRQKSAMVTIRSGMRPSKGYRFVECDFSGAEVITAASYNKDPNLINYLYPENPADAGDMHRDICSEIWCTTAKNVSKKARFYAKNCWTFPQFYGDWYGSCAPNLWEHREELLEDGMSCAESLKLRGIKTLSQFTDHCKDVQNIMWGERFKVYDEWRKEMQEYYQRELTVPTYFGFTFRGYMDRKQTCNFNIQSTSFHLLLKVLLRMREWIARRKMKTKIVGQIHDSGIFDSPESEYKDVIRQFMKYADELYDEFEWMEVPMTAEAEVSEIDGDFGHMTVFNLEE